MKKRGFTLVELLAVIVILGVILLIAVPKIIGVIEKTRLSSFYLNSDLFKSAVEKYVNIEQIEVPINTTVTINYTDVKNAGYISKLSDPKDNTECIYSKIEVFNNNGKYEFNPNLVCSNYIDIIDYNNIKNYNFSSETTDWSAIDSSISVDSGILLNTGNGAYNLPSTLQNTTLAAIEGHKIYVMAKTRVTNSNLTQMTLIFSSASWNWKEVAMNINSNQNTWYNISAVHTIDSSYSGNINFYISHGYSDSAIANNKNMEIDGNYGIYLLDLTSIYGSGNEPTKTQMDEIINNMQ